MCDHCGNIIGVGQEYCRCPDCNEATAYCSKTCLDEDAPLHKPKWCRVHTKKDGETLMRRSGLTPAAKIPMWKGEQFLVWQQVPTRECIGFPALPHCVRRANVDALDPEAAEVTEPRRIFD